MAEAAPLRIFLSHSTQDKGFCDALVATLRGAGADVWYDRQSLGPGVVLRREIMRQLSERPIFIVVLSKAACASSWVKDECEWAYDLWREEPAMRVLLPILAGPLDRTDFAELLYLKSMTRVEGENLEPLPQQAAIAETMRLFGLAPATAAPAPVSPMPTQQTPPSRAKANTVFLSYSHADGAISDKFLAALRGRGLDVWQDRDRIGLLGGNEWSASVQAGLERSGAYIVLLSPNSVASRFVNMETDAYLYMSMKDPWRRVLPVRIADCDIPILLASFRRIEAMTGDIDAAVDDIVRAIELPW